MFELVKKQIALARCRVERAKWQFLQGEYQAPAIEPTKVAIVACDLRTGKLLNTRHSHVSPYGAWAACANDLTARLGHHEFSVMDWSVL